MSLTSKIIDILDPQSGRLKETVLTDNETAPRVNLFEAKGGRRMTLQEATMTADFPMLLRDGIRTIAFDRYMATPVTWNQWADVLPSDKASEDWLEENSFGEFPVVHENTQYPEVKEDLDRTLNIRNYKRGMIVSVTEEMIRFNKVGLLTKRAAKLGRAAANTREQSCYTVLTTAGNYVRNSTTSDNDIGANTAATTFSATGLNTALTVLRTMKDRKSGAYLGVNPDLLIVAPRLEAAAKQLLLSPFLMGIGDAVSAVTYGQGTTNPFRGLVNRIIVSPRLGTSYQWVLMEAKQAVVLQEVEGFQIFQESAQRIEHEGWFTYDVIRYKARDWFGVGMLNDRYAYYSSSVTAPTVD